MTDSKYRNCNVMLCDNVDVIRVCFFRIIQYHITDKSRIRFPLLSVSFILNCQKEKKEKSAPDKTTPTYFRFGKQFDCSETIN